MELTVRASVGWAIGLTVVAAAGYLAVTKWQGHQRTQQEIQGQREYAARYLRVGDLEVAKINDGGVGGPIYSFSVVLTNTGDKSVDMVTVDYIAPEGWHFTSQDGNHTEPNPPERLPLILFCKADLPPDATPLCGPGATFRVGGAFAVRFEPAVLDRSLKPGFGPGILKLKETNVFY
jgi:hypothetical protein